VDFQSGKQQVIFLGSERRLDFTAGPLVMGIINCTPDSFYPGSRRPGTEEAVAEAERMISFGADILDIGGESSRPGADYLDAEEELGRVIPVIEKIRERSDIPVSVDTRKARVAEAALDAGADIVNDISALKDDPDLAPLAAARRVPVILMHKKGVPKTMQENPEYSDPVREIAGELAGYAEAAMEAGILRENIIIDPGIGFGKRLQDNLAILRNLKTFSSLGYPVLLGASRKSFLGMVLGADVEDRLGGTLAVHAWAVIHGADILRVHDVRETVEVIRVLSAIRSA